MGRKRIIETEKKVKVSISIKKSIHELLRKQGKPSQIIERLLEIYYNDKNI